MKKLIILLLFGVLFISCEDDNEEHGKEAAIEFCDCYKTKSKNECLEELKSNYSKSEYISDDFISAFNKESKCGVKLEKQSF